MIQNIVSCPSLTRQMLMAGFFSKKQYAAKEDILEQSLSDIPLVCIEFSFYPKSVIRK